MVSVSAAEAPWHYDSEVAACACLQTCPALHLKHMHCGETDSWGKGAGIALVAAVTDIAWHGIDEASRSLNLATAFWRALCPPLSLCIMSTQNLGSQQYAHKAHLKNCGPSPRLHWNLLCPALLISAGMVPKILLGMFSTPTTSVNIRFGVSVTSRLFPVGPQGVNLKMCVHVCNCD